MRNLLLISLISLFSTFFAHAQFQAVGSKEYGRIFDVIYDRTIADQLYGITLENHIVISENNGEDWSVFQVVSEGSFNGLQNNLKNLGEEHLTYFIEPGLSEKNRSVYVLNKLTREVERQYISPMPDAAADKVWINAYDILESNPDHVLLLVNYSISFSSFGKVYLTKNGGETWTEIYATQNHFNVFPENVAFSPDDADKIWITRGNGDSQVEGGLFVSNDGGQTWQEQLEGIVLGPIAFHPEKPEEIWLGTAISFGSSPQNVYRSNDGGLNWTIVPFEWDEYLFNNVKVIEFHPKHPEHLLILEENQVMISHDGGDTWQTKLYENSADETDSYFYGSRASFNPFQENEVFISASYYPFFSKDYGENMQRIHTAYFDTNGSVRHFSNDTQSHLYYGLQGGWLHVNQQTKEENAYQVKPLSDFSINDLGMLFIDPNQAGKVFFYANSFLGSNLLFSDSHGEDLKEIFYSFSNSLDDLKVVPGTDDQIWIALSSYGFTPQIYTLDFSNLNDILTHEILIPGVSGVVTAILFPTDDPLFVMIVRGNRVYQTTDGGQTWNEISQGLEILDSEDDMIYQMVQNPMNSSQISLATSQGIFTSTDFGENWTQLTEKLVHYLQHSSLVDGEMVAATHYSGSSEYSLSYSTNFGTTWETIEDDLFLPLKNPNIFSSTAVHFHGDFATVFSATADLGLIQYEINLKGLATKEVHSPKNSMILYPNPTSDFLHFVEDLDIHQVEVFNANGQRLIWTKHKIVNVSGLAAGIYFVKVLTKDQKKFSVKVIKK